MGFRFPLFTAFLDVNIYIYVNYFYLWLSNGLQETTR